MSTALQPRPGNASLVPFGLGSSHPVAYGPVARAAWDNRAVLGHALEVLQTPCTHCSTSGVHLCEPRLAALVDHHRAPIVPFDVRDTERLRALSADELRALGRVRAPLIRTRRGFEAVGWDDALLHAAPHGSAVWAPAVRGLTDEVYAAIAQVAEQVVFPDAPAVPGAANTEDLDEADCIVIWDVPIAERAPDLLRHLARARRRGARVVAIGAPDPSIEVHRFPNTWRAALFGEVAVDTWFRARDPEAVVEAYLNPSRDLRARTGLAAAHLEQLRHELDGGRVIQIVDRVRPAFVELQQALGRSGVGTGILRVPEGHGIEAASQLGLSGTDVTDADWCVVFGEAGGVPASTRVFVDTHLRPAMLAPADKVVVLPVQPAATQRGGGWISADGRVYASVGASRFGGTVARAAWSIPAQLVAAADPARSGDVPETLDPIRAALRELPAYRNTENLQPGAWARVPRV